VSEPLLVIIIIDIYLRLPIVNLYFKLMKSIDPEPDNLKKANSLKGFSWPQQPERSSA
jgi:hypothetical protein